MDSKDIKNLCEAYIAVYDEDLRGELETDSIEEDLSFIDDLSDNELTQIMEEIFDENFIEIDECFESLDLVLSEATVTMGGVRTAPATGASRVTSSADRRAGKTSERMQKVRVGRLAQAAQRAAEYPGKKAKEVGGRAKTLAGGAASAVAGGAAEAGRKLKAAKEKVKGFLGRVGRAAKAGASAAKKEFSGQAGKEAQARVTGRQMRRAARKSAASERAKDTSEFNKKAPSKSSDPWEGSATTPKSRLSATTKTTKVLPGSSERKALPAGKESERMAAARQKLAKASSGSSSRGVRFATSSGKVAPQRAHTGVKSALERFRKKAGVTQEDFEIILSSIFEDLIQEGYASDFDEAFELIESLSEFELDDLMESYLEDTEVETLDLYDVVVEHLIDEGYADDVESAEVIMVNMSEEWRSEILESGMKAPKAGDPIPHNIRSQIQREQDPESPENKERAERRAKRKGRLQFQVK